MLDLLYQGSVKDVRGPLQLGGESAVVFEYTDAYSVFDWGRMPDLLPQKGQALAWMAALFFERLEDPAQWREFSKSPQALQLRKGRGGLAFMELGERLQSEGLRTHYLGLGTSLKRTSDFGTGAALPSQLVVRQVEATRPRSVVVLGRTVPDYASVMTGGGAGQSGAAAVQGGGVALNPSAKNIGKLIPLESVFRYSLPAGSSLMARVAANPQYLVTRGFGDYAVKAGAQYDFPILELFTKLEPKDRELELSEALALSGAYAKLSGAQFTEMCFLTAWVSGFLRYQFARVGLELADGKLEWALNGDGGLMLVDAIGPDELRVLDSATGIQVSKECLRQFYRGSTWVKALDAAKGEAERKGILEWKRLVVEQPALLDSELKGVISEVYLALANEISGRGVFSGARGLAPILADLSRLSKKSVEGARS